MILHGTGRDAWVNKFHFVRFDFYFVFNGISNCKTDNLQDAHCISTLPESFFIPNIMVRNGSVDIGPENAAVAVARVADLPSRTGLKGV